MSGTESAESRPTTAAALLRRHWVFALVFALGLTARLLVIAAFHQAFLMHDSRRYFWSAQVLRPDYDRVSGYSLLMRLVPHWTHLWPEAVVQHVLGLGIGALLYWFLLRRGAPSWAAGLATVPILLDPFQVAIEHYVLSDIAFETFLVCGFVALSVRRRVGWRLALLGGVLLGCADITRSVGDVLIAVAAVTLLLGQARWRPVLALILGAAIPIAGYAAWYHHDFGAYRTQRFPENLLYGRVAQFVDCTHLTLPADERGLCPGVPIYARGTPYFYTWAGHSPWRQVAVPPGTTRWALMHDFNRRAIEQQFPSYLHLVVSDAARVFYPARHGRPDDSGETHQWRFGAAGHGVKLLPDVGRPARAGIDQSLAHDLGVYSDLYLPGPVWALLAVFGLLGALGVGRARRSGLRSTAALFTVATLLMMLTSTAVSIFSWRYQLPDFALLPAGAVLGLMALTRRTPDPDARSAAATFRALLPGRRRHADSSAGDEPLVD